MTSRRLQPVRVLLVDEREAPSIQIEKLLWRNGAAVRKASTLDEALRLAREHVLDLALVRLTLHGRDGSVAALSLPQASRRLRLFLYGDKLEARSSVAVRRARRRATLLREECLPDWIPSAIPLLARIVRDEARVARASRAVALPKLSTTPLPPLPVDLNEVVGTLEEALVRAALEARQCKRQAAKLLGISESSLRTKLRKLSIVWPPERSRAAADK